MQFVEEVEAFTQAMCFHTPMQGLSTDSKAIAWHKRRGLVYKYKQLKEYTAELVGPIEDPLSHVC